MKEAKHKKNEMEALKNAPATVTITTKSLGKAPEEKTFVLKDGRKLRTLYELVDELETMSEGIFREYVNDMKNDFANWIEGVFGDKALAADLRKIKNRIEAQHALLKHLVRDLRRATGQ
jgi:hypothetical protein